MSTTNLYAMLYPPKHWPAIDLCNTVPTTEEPPKSLIWTRSILRPPTLRYGFPLDEKFVTALAASEGYVPENINSPGDRVRLFEVGADIIGHRAGLDLERRRVLNVGYRDIVELGNNIHPARVSPEDIEKVKAILGTDKDPMWFLDYCDFRWTVLS